MGSGWLSLVSGMIFLEAVFITDPLPETGHSAWKDLSNADYFVFESVFGAVRLRKRTTYPRTFACIEGTKLIIGYGDRERGERVACRPLKEAPSSAFYDGEFLYILADCKSQQVIVQRDALCVLPLFVGRQAQRLSIANHYDVACQLLGDMPVHADRVAIAQTLCAKHTYDRTLLEEVKVLYDRQRLLWSAASTSIEEPMPGDILKVSKKRDGTIKEFRRRLEATLDKYWERYASETPVGCELSGGLDSTTILGYYADKKKPILALTQRFPGEFGKSQDAKITAIANRFSIDGFSVEMDPAIYFPLSHLAKNNTLVPLYQWQVDNPDALAVLYEPLKAQGASVVFGGIGGNELYENIPDLETLTNEELVNPYTETDALPSWCTDEFVTFLGAVAGPTGSPRRHAHPLTSHSVALGSMRGNNFSIDHNLWPVHPLADPQLYLYTQSLPIRYRHNRNLMRMYMAARQFPAMVYDPQVPNENFGPFFREGAANNLEPLLRIFLEHSLLDRAGILRKQAVLKIFYEAKNNLTDESEKLLSDVLQVLIVEVSLQAHGRQKVIL
jgi:hypothetical protein